MSASHEKGSDADLGALTDPLLDLSTLPPPVAQILRSADFPQFYSATIVHQFPADLRATVAALDNSTVHLHESNAHLQQAADDPDNSDDERKKYQQYIKDNEHVIAANEYRVGILNQLIKRKTKETTK